MPTREELAQHIHRANAGPDSEWFNLTEDGQQGYLREADAIFATLLIPEGWPEGFHLGRVVEVNEPRSIPGWRAEIMQRHGATTFCVASVHGPFQVDTEERARLVAQTIAQSRIVCGRSQSVGGGSSRQSYEDLKRDHAALLAAVDGLGGYRAQITALKSQAPNLSSHLTPTVRRALRSGLLTLLTESGEVSPEQVDDALDDAGKMAALLLRVRAPTPF